MRACHLFLVLGFAAAAAAVSAADGVTDFIVHPLNGYTINQPGSYRLSGDATIDDESSTAITVNVDNVTIDLNGHTLKWASVISGITRGINAQGRKNLIIRNGRLIGFRDVSIECGSGARLEGITVQGCGNGIILGDGASVTNCTVLESLALPGVGETYGIRVGNASVVRDCVITGCTASEGFSAIYANGTRGLTVTGCSINGNTLASEAIGTFYGIRAGSYATVERNSISWNYASQSGNAFGIHTVLGGVIRNNVCSQNFAGNNATGYGIFSNNGFALIEGNQCDYNSNSTATNNSAVGIRAGTDCRVMGNIATDNDGRGTGTGVGIIITTWSIAQGNHCSSQTGGTAAYGIQVLGARNTIRDNTTVQNGTAGIRFEVGGNRCEMNRLSDTVGIYEALLGSTSLGAGDLANINF